MKASRLIAFTLLGSLAIAAPVTYWVITNDTTPSDFVKQVDAAFNAWKAVPSTTLKLEKNQDSNLQFSWSTAADDIPINPDTITRTITNTGDDSKVTNTTVNVNPDQSENLESGLLVEAGLRLGLPLEASIEGKRSIGELETKALRGAFQQTGDFNGDGKVNLDDLEILAANYGKKDKPVTNLNGDLNGDGVVNDADLEIMKTNYSFEIAPEKNLTPETPTPPTTPTKPPANSTTPATPATPTTPTSPVTPAIPTTPTSPTEPTPPATDPNPPTDPSTPNDPSTPPTDPATPPPSNP